MRTYRGKTEQGEWVYGNLIQSENQSIIIVKTKRDVIESDSIGHWSIVAPAYRVIHETVSQCTGLKGMYFQDIVSYKDEAGNNQIGIVTEYDYCGGYIHCLGGDEEGNQDLELHPDYEYNVIGNIHDNPELITKPIDK